MERLAENVRVKDSEQETTAETSSPQGGETISAKETSEKKKKTSWRRKSARTEVQFFGKRSSSRDQGPTTTISPVTMVHPGEERGHGDPGVSEKEDHFPKEKRVGPGERGSLHPRQPQGSICSPSGGPGGKKRWRNIYQARGGGRIPKGAPAKVKNLSISLSLIEGHKREAATYAIAIGRGSPSPPVQT